MKPHSLIVKFFSDGSSGPVILQILPSDATEDMGEIYGNPSPPAAKRQKIVHLVTSVPGTSSQQVTRAKVVGQVRKYLLFCGCCGTEWQNSFVRMC